MCQQTHVCSNLNRTLSIKTKPVVAKGFIFYKKDNKPIDLLLILLYNIFKDTGILISV